LAGRSDPEGSTFIDQLEVSLVAQLPHHIAGSGPVLEVDLDDPVLVPYGEQQVVVVAGVEHGIGVGPVGEVHRLPVHAAHARRAALVGQAVERVPHPIGVAVLVHVYNGVAEHGGVASPEAVALRVAGQHHPVAVGQHQHVVMEALELVRDCPGRRAGRGWPAAPC